MKLDIDKLSARELDLLLAIAERRKKLLSGRRPAAVVRRELTALAASHGYAIQELFGAGPKPVGITPAKKAKRERATAKYRNPENRRDTWSGRGRMPRWLSEKTKRGQRLADFLIPGLGRPTERKSRRIGQRSVFKKN